MPWQLIYTSAPRGLLSGQSGFGTVARSADLREALAQRLEQISSYHYLRVAEAATANSNPTVCAFRILDLRGSKYFVLTRIQPCGLDFTARTNHLAHHLVFQPGDLAQLPSPAAILRHWNGWLSSWQGEPRMLDDVPLHAFAAGVPSHLPAQTWQRVTGDAGRAAGLLEGECARGCYLVCPPRSEGQVLDLFCESLDLLNPNNQFPLRAWRHPFTTFLQAEDNAADFHWRACQEDTPAHQQAVQGSAAMIPLRAVRVPANSLAKVAREGHKAPEPSRTEPPTKTKLTLRQSEARRSDSSMEDTNEWQNPASSRERADRSGIRILIDTTALIRIVGVVLLVLGLLFMKFWVGKKNVPPPAVPSNVQAAPPATPVPRYQARAAAPDLAQLDGLPGDSPTFLFFTSDVTSFELPMSSLSRFQNLINRFDKLSVLPNVIQLSLNTNAWDFRVGSPLNVHGRQQAALTAQSPDGIDFSLDYSNWKNDPNNPVKVQAAFATPPGSFSLRFGFSTPDQGEPFRLLIVNTSNPPPPLHLGLAWLKAGYNSVAASLQPPLDERLLGNFILPAPAKWQLLPFVKTGDGPPHYLYKDWPAADLPATGAELDFASVKKNLTERKAPLDEKTAQAVQLQSKLAGLDTPLGKDLGVKDPKLESLSTFAPKAGPDDFIRYLNALKKHVQKKDWPRVNVDDDPADLAEKFQRICDVCLDINPDAKADLTIVNTNYFAAIWRSLNNIDKVRLENQRAQDDADKLQQRLAAVPDSLDKAAYVGLFIFDPPGPAMEMIRFEGQ